MPAVAEGNVVKGGVDELVLQSLTLALSQLRKAEGVEGLRVSVVHLVTVCRMCGRDDESTLGKERAVTQGDVLHNFTRERR